MAFAKIAEHFTWRLNMEFRSNGNTSLSELETDIGREQPLAWYGQATIFAKVCGSFFFWANRQNARFSHCPLLFVFGSRLRYITEVNSVDLQITTTNLTIDQQQHLHTYIDGKLASMDYSTAVHLENLPSGIHDICIVVGDLAHADTSVKDGIRIVVTGMAAMP